MSLILTLVAAGCGVIAGHAAVRGLLSLAPPGLPRLDATRLGRPHVAFVVLTRWPSSASPSA